MLRNPSLYGITHEEIEKDPLLEQVPLLCMDLINPIDRLQLAFDLHYM